MLQNIVPKLLLDFKEKEYDYASGNHITKTG